MLRRAWLDDACPQIKIFDEPLRLGFAFEAIAHVADAFERIDHSGTMFTAHPVFLSQTAPRPFLAGTNQSRR